LVRIYSKHITPRLEWISQFIFGEILGYEIDLTNNKNDLHDPKNTACINYSENPLEKIPQIVPQGLLSEQGIRSFEVKDFDKNKRTFFQNGDDFLQFDFLSAAFFLVSRYEEYWSHEKDNHGRYSFKNSLASKHQFIEEPIVDQWAYLVRKKLQEHFPNLKSKNREFTYIPTMDVDVAFEFRGRSGFRNLKSSAKDITLLDGKRLAKRIKVLKGAENYSDAFDTYDYFEKLTEDYNLKNRYFFLLGDYGPFDKNLSHKNKTLQALIKRLESKAGSHPSYKTHQVDGQLGIEKKRLEEITGSEVEDSRFHYLKFDTSRSFKLLYAQKYKRDYSMAYPEQPGFRAGTCTPFYFYDLANEEVLDLFMYPTTIMDATCQDYLNMTPNQCLSKMNTLIDKVKSVGGTFICLWHNDTMSETGKWKGWKEVLAKNLSYAYPKKGKIV